MQITLKSKDVQAVSEEVLQVMFKFVAEVEDAPKTNCEDPGAPSLEITQIGEVEKPLRVIEQSPDDIFPILKFEDWEEIVEEEEQVPLILSIFSAPLELLVTDPTNTGAFCDTVQIQAFIEMLAGLVSASPAPIVVVITADAEGPRGVFTVASEVPLIVKAVMPEYP